MNEFWLFFQFKMNEFLGLLIIFHEYSFWNWMNFAEFRNKTVTKRRNVWAIMSVLVWRNHHSTNSIFWELFVSNYGHFVMSMNEESLYAMS